MAEFVLRDYQQEAIDAIVSDWTAGTLNVILALPTGLGKTEVAVYLLKQTLALEQRALFLAHRDELLQQPLARFNRHWPKLDLGIVKAERDDTGARVILGSVQTCCRPNRLAPILLSGRIDYLVTDEAHHSAADSYQRIYQALREANPDVKHVGLTATPKRTDGKRLVGPTYNKVAYQMNIQKAIRGGWLVPPEGVQIETGVSLLNCDCLNGRSVGVARGDFVPGELADVLDASHWHELVADAYQEHAADRQALAYTPTVRTSQNLAAELVFRGITAVHVDGTTPKQERREAVRRFRAREIQVLANCAVYLEGFDAPSADCILMARPTQSHVLLTQVIGRGLRIFPGKENCLVLLFATTGARILTLFDLGESKELKEAKEKAEKLGVPGVSEPIPLFDENAIDGVGVYAKAVDLFGGDDAAWYRDGAAFSVGLGTKDDWQRILYIAPPNGSDDWRLFIVGRRDYKGARWKAQEIASEDEVGMLLAMAADIIERNAVPVLAKKNRRWRKDPATCGQKRWAQKYVGDAAELLSKGGAAQVINHGVATDVLRRAGLT